jgi:hypothetical protein
MTSHPLSEATSASTSVSSATTSHSLVSGTPPTECKLFYVMLDDLKPIGEAIHRTVVRAIEPVTTFILEIHAMYAPDARHLSHGNDPAYNARYAKSSKPLTEPHVLGTTAVDDVKSQEIKVPEKEYDPSYFWSHLFTKPTPSPLPFYMEPAKKGAAKVREMAESIVRDGYFCENRVNKYYAIAFAINDGRFYVYSKDCPPQLISWHATSDSTDTNEDESTMAFLGTKPSNDVNDGPVVQLMRLLNPVDKDLDVI